VSVIVAKTLSRGGGKCADDKAHEIPVLGVIYKVSTEGGTTVFGQGPGKWVCPLCADEYEDPRGIYQRSMF